MTAAADAQRVSQQNTGAGDAPDPRVDEAMICSDPSSRLTARGFWREHPSRAIHFAFEDGDGRPSRWNTLNALRLLRWHEQ